MNESKLKSVSDHRSHCRPLFQSEKDLSVLRPPTLQKQHELEQKVLRWLLHYQSFQTSLLRIKYFKIDFIQWLSINQYPTFLWACLITERVGCKVHSRRNLWTIALSFIGKKKSFTSQHLRGFPFSLPAWIQLSLSHCNIRLQGRFTK